MHKFFIRLAARANNPPHPWQIVQNDDEPMFFDEVEIMVPSQTSVQQEPNVDRFGRYDRDGIECMGFLHVNDHVATIKSFP